MVNLHVNSFTVKCFIFRAICIYNYSGEVSVDIEDNPVDIPCNTEDNPAYGAPLGTPCNTEDNPAYGAPLGTPCNTEDNPAYGAPLGTLCNTENNSAYSVSLGTPCNTEENPAYGVPLDIPCNTEFEDNPAYETLSGASHHIQTSSASPQEPMYDTIH